jgi:hypothetical protein
MEEGERKVTIVKLGEFKLNDFNVLVINKTDYSGQDKIDFRVWSNSPKYKGPTKQGFNLTMDKMQEFVDFVATLKTKLAADLPSKKEGASKETKKKKTAKKRE